MPLKRLHGLCVLPVAAWLLASGAARAQDANPAPAAGWQTYSIGAGRGDATLSLGAQFWKDRFRFRNLIARTTLDLAPGIRAHLTARRREGSWQRMPFHPDVDEAYVEGMAFYRAPSFDLAFDLKGGRVRYLRFPAPDMLSVFDQVPGIRDLTGGPETDYRGALFSFEGAHRSGLGFHFDGIRWGFDAPSSGMNAIEWYGFARRGFGDGWTVEGRFGALAQRPEPLGRPARRGGSFFLGKRLGEFEVGAMVEKLRGYPTYTGIMVRFRPTDITRALGKIGFDYDRSPDGIAVQYDLLHVRFNENTHVAPDEELVGEVRAVRLRTYWQQGFQRNEYEHRLSSWGITQGPGLRVVVEEQPWHLDLEALVSPHTTPNRAWFRDRQGPAQLAQEVTYKFYRKR
jgi:hypothetical protein